ncbi:PhoA Alkaline phosphatase [Pyrenophora tritici-repentis]|uniref:Alkaline phosphatase n=2 Tax=Pyrenophora tritici-repentis TaxID=45151 RepID=A0A2W1EB81_9PLEO|nr:alkaline phosphatase [Pyrenophora tritici-repentis Pt-1C-BFP]KAA8620935.1 Alkaline phosphatase [Pyrenophora tritici-repentis]EDU43372.1 alkaline phosphatase [Pyrenophora tritici-repentis Pt-1C-BFP]KAF7450180.1 Alkaline phosphatase [Pyrenophora tritici-repentis]KAF7572748.1 PhoA, Alkaline phosphatase [Pyrenophora tritici-repentis]KAG9376152.1 Alkaline phosphatase [Pyrenophora tritici-repentis]
MSGARPLLSNRASSDISGDRDMAEEDALLTGRRTGHTEKGGSRPWKFWREIGLFVWAVIATAAVVILAVIFQQSNADSQTPKASGKRNLIFMVSDGMGPTSLSLTRSYMQFKNGAPFSEQLVIDQHLIGQSRTRSSSSLITDSAAGATAFSCAQKSYNGAISVTPDHEPCGTVLEAAKKAGYMTGLVVTTRITDATPACFAAHVNMRSEEDRIAEQMIGEHPLGRVVDLMFGGGRCHFLPNSTIDSSCRADGKDVIGLAKKNGFSYISDRAGFNKLKQGANVDMPMLGLFADTDIPYEIDRRNENDIYPSLHEMAEAAMRALSDATRDSDKGFFLMIEGSRIDHAGHHNDPAAQVHEVLAYDRAFNSVLDFIKREKTQTVMVSTSDHETGGLAVARQLHTSYPEYAWYPSPLANASHSAERLALLYAKHLLSGPTPDQKADFVRDSISTGLGINDYTDEEVQNLVKTPDTALYQYADMMSRRSQTGWSTHGHSGADVNIYSSDPKAASALVGNHENTEVGDFLRDYLAVDVEAITKELLQKGKGFMVQMVNDTEISWIGKVPVDGERLDGQTHLASYSGDHKKRNLGSVHGDDCGCGH